MDENKISEETKFKIKNSHHYKFGGVAPDGYILIPEITLERLKDFDVWKEWLHNPELLTTMMIEDSKKI